jgi:hypothetical protein
MKTKRSQHKQSEGSVLLVTMCVLAVGLIALSGYLMIVQAENNAVSRSQAWNAIISVSEAGVEEGMALVDQGAPNIVTDEWAWTNSIGHWSGNNGIYTLTRYVYGSNSFTVTVDATGAPTTPPTISSVGNVPYTAMPWAFSANRGPVFAAAGMPFLAAGTVSGGTSNSTSSSSGSTTLARKVQVQTILNPLFTAAIVTKSNFDFHGNNGLVDSFDSSNPSFNDGTGQYVTTKREANGNVGTDSSIANSLHIKNGNIYGSVMTGPGTVQSEVDVGANGAVGDASWNVGHTGIQSNHWSGDFNVAIPDVQPPSGGSSFPTNVNYNGTPSKVLSGGTYVGTDPGVPLVITAPKTTVWIQGGFTPGVGGITIVSSNAASLVLYVGTVSGSGDTLKMSGQGTINSPGYANNLQIYGLPSLTSVDFTGNSKFVGTIYAPEADMKGGGSGNNNLDTSGAMIVKSVTLTGHWNFHYDQALTNNGPSRGWIPKNWTEVKYP